MPVLQNLHGSYARAQITQPLSFQLNGASAPTVLRDGTAVASATGKIFTVTRASAGLYTLTLERAVWPERPFVHVALEQAAAPTAHCQAHYVRDSYSASTRSFQVAVRTCAANAASDADAGDRICVSISGGISSAGKDPA